MSINKKQNYATEDVVGPTHYESSAPCIGRLAGTNKRGDILVQFDGCEPKAAKLVAGLNRVELMKDECQGREVLLVFDRGNPDCPIIVGFMADPLESLISLLISKDDQQEPKEVLIDGKRITIEAENEIILKCGPGSIMLRNDGKIVIKGRHILSRSKGVNKIKGGAVRIN